MEGELEEYAHPVVVDNQLTPYGKSEFRISELLSDTILEMPWKDDDLVLDIGCGKGYKTVYVVLPLIQKYKKYLAIDSDSSLIRYAQSKCPANNLEYHVADITELSSFPREWHGKITKVISIDCLHYLWNDERLFFENMYQLMASEGEAVLTFHVSSELQVICDELKKKPKWEKFVDEPEQRIFLSSPLLTLEASGFLDLVRDVGFSVVAWGDGELTLAYENDEAMRNELKEEWKTGVIQKEEEDEFAEDILNSVLNFYGRTDEGNPVLIVKTLILYLRKP